MHLYFACFTPSVNLFLLQLLVAQILLEFVNNLCNSQTVNLPSCYIHWTHFIWPRNVCSVILASTWALPARPYVVNTKWPWIRPPQRAMPRLKPLPAVPEGLISYHISYAWLGRNLRVKIRLAFCLWLISFTFPWGVSKNPKVDNWLWLIQTIDSKSLSTCILTRTRSLQTLVQV